MTLRQRFGKIGESCMLSVVRTKRLRGLMPLYQFGFALRLHGFDALPVGVQFCRCHGAV